MSYDAFISYAHGNDSRVAKALQDGLHAIAKPWEALSSLRVVRDDTHLAPGDSLERTISNALDTSGHLILIASPDAARSPWVRREIQRFLAARDAGKILIVHLSGELVWDPAAGDYREGADRAFPSLESPAFAAEPLHLDLQWAQEDARLSLDNPRFRDAVASLAAALRGVPKESLVGGFLQEQLRLRGNQRINLAIRGALGFGGAAGILLALTVLTLALGSIPRLFLGFSLVGCLGALTCGLGFRGMAAFAAAFGALLPFYAVASVSPHGSSALELAVLSLVCVLGFAGAGASGAGLSRSVRWWHGAAAFGLGGLVAAIVWLGVPEWRSRGLGTHLFGPWQWQRLQIVAATVRHSDFFVHLAPFVIGAAVGGLLLGLRIADSRIELPLRPTRPLPLRFLARMPARAWQGVFAGLVLACAACGALRQTTAFQLRASASALEVSEVRQAFDHGLHVGYGVDDPEVFRLVLRCRRALRERGMIRAAEDFSQLLDDLLKEYARYGDQFYSDSDGLVDVARAFVELGALEELKRLLEAAEKTASEPPLPELYDFNSAQALVAVSGAWAVSGDLKRSAAVLERAQAFSRAGGEPLDPNVVAQTASSLLRGGRDDAARNLLTSLDVSPCSAAIGQSVVLQLRSLWPQDCRRSGLPIVVALLHAGQWREALEKFKAPGVIDFVNQDISPVLSAAVESGQAEAAFSMQAFAEQASYHQKPVMLLHAIAEAAKAAKDEPTLKKARGELQERLEGLVRTATESSYDHEDREAIVQALWALTAAGDLETGRRRLEPLAFEEHVIHLAFAKAFLERGQRTEAHDALVRSWSSAYLVGMSPQQKEIAELLVELGDLRGSRSIADDQVETGSSEIVRRYSLYCLILESAS